MIWLPILFVGLVVILLTAIVCWDRHTFKRDTRDSEEWRARQRALDESKQKSRD